MFTAGVSNYYLNQVDNSYSDLVNRRAVILANTLQMQTYTVKQINSLRGYLLTKDPQFQKSLNSYYNQLQEFIDKTSPLLLYASDKERLQTFAEANKQFKEKYDPLL